MRPTFAIPAAGNDITGDVSARLVSLTITDTVDETSDDMTLVLEDVGGTLAMPKSGAKLEVSLGYDFQNTRIGSFVVDEVELEGPPDQVTIKASSTPFVSDRGGGGAASFQSRKSREWEGKTIGDIVSSIAGECGLSPVVDKNLESVTIPHIAQVAESDANLLLRIARRYGAVMKPADGRLVLALESGGQTTSGKTLELPVMLVDVSSYRFKLGGKLQGVTKVRAKVHSYDTGESEDVEIKVEGGGQFLAPEGATGQEVDVFYERLLADNAGDVETAKKSVKSTAQRISRSKKQFDISMPGNVALVSGMHVNLTGFRPENNGRYKVMTVRHTLTRSGFTTSITGEGAE